MSEMDENVAKAVEFLLGSQLGSDDDDLFDGKVNVMRLSKISELEAFCFPYISQIPGYRGGNAARKYVHMKLNMNMSIHGWRSQLINAFVGATRGVPSIELARKPGWFGRNFNNRNWKDKAEEEGKDVID